MKTRYGGRSKDMADSEQLAIASIVSTRCARIRNVEKGGKEITVRRPPWVREYINQQEQQKYLLQLAWVSRDLGTVPQHLIQRLKSRAGCNIAFVSVCAILKSCRLEGDLQTGRTLLRS